MVFSLAPGTPRSVREGVPQALLPTTYFLPNNAGFTCPRTLRTYCLSISFVLLRVPPLIFLVTHPVGKDREGELSH